MKRIGFFLLILFLLMLFLVYVTISDSKEQKTVVADYSENINEYTDTQVNPSQPESQAEEDSPETVPEETGSVRIQIEAGSEKFIAVPEDNSSAKAFVTLLCESPVTVQMHDYAGMEKVGSLGRTLPRNDRQIKVSAGDVILYQGNQITIYYDNNSWNFTKLATIEDTTGDRLLEMLGTGDVEVTFSIA